MTAHPTGTPLSRTAKVLLVVALVGVVGMAFRVSWNALRDVAHAVGADATAAALYPFVVDGLMALALVATLVLVGDDRRFALRVLAGYTLASLTLNYVHGLVPTMRSGERMHLAGWAPANWTLVLLATSLPVGAIYYGSDLVAKVLHHRTDEAKDAPRTEPAQRTATPASAAAYGTSPQASRRTPTPSKPRRTAARTTRSKAYDEAEMERVRQRAEQVYAESLDAGKPIGPAALGREFGFSEGWARKRIKAVDARRTRGELVGAPATR